MKRSEEIIKQIDEQIEKGEVVIITARFGDNWKEHQKKLLREEQIDIDMILELAWKQGRRGILLEKAIEQLTD